MCSKLFFSPSVFLEKFDLFLRRYLKNGLVAQWIEQLPSKQ